MTNLFGYFAKTLIDDTKAIGKKPPVVDSWKSKKLEEKDAEPNGNNLAILLLRLNVHVFGTR